MLLLSWVLAAVPQIHDPVTDLGDVLTPAGEAQIDAQIRTIREETGVQIAVLTVPTSGPEHTIESFSLAVAEQWGGGEVGLDDGLLIVLAVDDRRSRIEVGYGLEPYLTDTEAGNLLAASASSLREGDYDGAITRIVGGAGREVDTLVAGERPIGWRQLAQARRWLPAESWSTALFILFGMLTSSTSLMAWRRSPPTALTKRLPDPLWIAGGWALVVAALLGLYRMIEGDFTVLRCIQLVGGAVTGAAFGFASSAGRFWVGVVCNVVLFILVLIGDLDIAEDGAQGFFWVMYCLMVGPMMLLALTGLVSGGGDGSDWGSGGSSTSSGSSAGSSGSSGGGDWGGGGGGFGGGGASGSW